MKKFLLITTVIAYLITFFGISIVELSTDITLWSKDNRACLVFMPPFIVIGVWGSKNILDS